MRRIIIGAAAGFVIILASVGTAGAAIMQTRLHSTGASKVSGTVVWLRASEQVPIFLSVKGAAPGSEIAMKVCGPTRNGDTGTTFDQCWLTFEDPVAHDYTVNVGKKGTAQAALYAKLGVGPVSLVKPQRFELYAASDLTNPIAVGQLNSRR